MSEKRFDTNGYYINDTFSDGRKWLVNEVEAKEIVDVMNNLDMKARERSKALSKLQKKVDEQQDIIEAKDSLLSILSKENEKLRFLIDINSVSERKKLERQVDEQQSIINEQNEAIEYLKTVIRYTLPNQMVADVFKEIGEEYE